MSITLPTNRLQRVPYMEDPRLTRYTRKDFEDQQQMLIRACKKYPTIRQELRQLRDGINPRTNRHVDMDGQAYRNALNDTLMKIDGDFWLYRIPNVEAYIAHTEELYRRHLHYNIKARIINQMIAELETN